MPIDLEPTDVVLIGVGAVGGVAALPLARAGLDVIGLEAGNWLTARDFAPDELRNNIRGWPQSIQKANREVPTHRRSEGAPYSRRPPVHPMMNAVGGTSLHYWGQSWRLNPWDFRVVSETARRYGAGRIPAGSTVEDWPFGLEELEPYYDAVEYEVGISGQAGNINGTVDERGNIFEGPRQREFPMPPLRGSGFTELMSDAARGLGWHPFPGPAAIASRTYDGRAGCVYHGFCSRGGCHIDAKSSTLVSTIPKAMDTGRFSVVARARVSRIEVDNDGRVRGVTYFKDGEEYFQPADAVLLASYVYENVRMLLLSKSAAFPDGLSNNRGQVGRHYFTHNHRGWVTALFPFDLNNWYGAAAQGVAVDDWADDNFDHAGLDFIGGGNLWVYTERRPINAAGMNTFGRAPRWGSEWKSFIRENADRWTGSYLQKTTLPYDDNYLDLDPNVTDPYGDPVCRITADFKENEVRLWVYTERRPINAAGMNTFGRAPRWGSEWKSFIRENADRWTGSYLQKTTLPYEDNYLDLDPNVTDPYGDPVCRITADFKENEVRLTEFIQDRMVEWFTAAGAIETIRNDIETMGPATHAYGGTRMGRDPDTNVVDEWGFSHEAPNLGILGGSVMGTSGARNPTLTAQALAWRTAAHLAGNWSTIAG